VVSKLATGSKVRELKPGPGQIFKDDKTRSTPSFGGEVKTPVLCRKILQHVKEPFEA
jgi:hypothetical protein